MADQPTCGQGLAEHSLLPAKLGELTASLAENLEVHMKALDLNDANAKKEHDVYRRLAKECREAAAQLQAIGREMADQRELPMGRHDENAMSSPKVIDVFENFVKIEQQLLAMLQQRVGQHQKILAGRGWPEM
jgi:hypothetical protein